jgi:hypothetical protein
MRREASVLRWDADREPIGPRVLLLASTVSLAAGFALAAGGGGPRVRLTAFVLVTIAAMIRQGEFPAHVWIPRAFERGSLPVLNVLLSGRPGIYLLVRFGIDMLHGTTGPFTWLEGLGPPVCRVHRAARARRTAAALLCASRSAFLTGLVSGNIEGNTGALVHWWELALTTTLLVTRTGQQCAGHGTVRIRPHDRAPGAARARARVHDRRGAARRRGDRRPAQHAGDRDRRGTGRTGAARHGKAPERSASHELHDELGQELVRFAVRSGVID